MKNFKDLIKFQHKNNILHDPELLAELSEVDTLKVNQVTKLWLALETYE